MPLNKPYSWYLCRKHRLLVIGPAGKGARGWEELGPCENDGGGMLDRNYEGQAILQQRGLRINADALICTAVPYRGVESLSYFHPDALRERGL